MQQRAGPLMQADAFLRATFNGALLGADAYSTIKLLLVLLGVSRVLKDLRRASRCEGLYSWLMACISPWLKRLPFVQSQLKKETDKLRHDIQPSLIKDLTQPKTRLPAAGMAEDKVLKLMLERRELDTKYWQDGRVTGAIYHGKREYMDFVGQVAGLFAFTNPLHASIHPATRQMESEVISMVLRMYSGPATACGAFTTGGTESILMAMKAYRDKGRAERGITEPNIVVCVTAHAAFDKAAQYFNLECRTARTTGPQAVDLVHVRSLIDANTVAIVGSACQYAHGTIDNIPKLSELALSYGVGLHVDCCLGGFLVPFMRAAGFELPHEYDFRVPGVTTISCDPHKYGFAPKGSSVLMFRTPELRHYMYTFVTEWTGGIYATPSILGSRPGGVVAATWAAMIHHGEAGYIETTRQIVGATRKIGAAIEAIDGLELMGRPDVCVVAWHGKPGSGINCYSLCDALKEIRGWDLATLQRPASVHLALTLPTSANADLFIADLKEAVAMVRADPVKYSGGTAGLYGTASKMPASFVEESAKVFLDVMTLAAEEESAPGAAAA